MEDSHFQFIQMNARKECSPSDGQMAIQQKSKLAEYINAWLKNGEPRIYAFYHPAKMKFFENLRD
jgi:hypothetical protein